MSAFADPGVVLLLLAGVAIGLIFGVLPGLSGLTALALLLPFVYGISDPFAAIGFLLVVRP